MTEAITEHDLRSDDAERSLLGALVLSGTALADVLARLPGSDFYSPHRGYVWDACRALSEDREPIEPTRVARRLAAAGRWNPATQAVVSAELLAANDGFFAGAHADTVADLARRRELLRAIRRAEVIARDCPGEASEALGKVRAEFESIGPALGDQRGTLDWDALVAEFQAEHNDATDDAAPVTPITTPWPELDALLGGLFPGRLYAVGGRPGMGKSAMAINLAADAAVTQRRPTLIVSREMSTVEIAGRIFARATETPLNAINARRTTETQMANIEDFWAKVGRPPLVVDDMVHSWSAIKALARTQAHQSGLDLFIVDYLQLVTVESARSREQEVAQVSRELKLLARELECAVVVPAQLNRGSLQRADKRPVMSDFRESGAIEQDSDVVILLHREQQHDAVGEIEFIVDKNRHGATATLTFDWVGPYGVIS